MAAVASVVPTCETATPANGLDAITILEQAIPKSQTSRIAYISGKDKGLMFGDTEVDLEAVVPAEKPSAGFGGEYIKSFVFGGLDGIVSTFALVAGLGGAQVNVGTLIAVSLAKVLADGFSMGFGEFTSAKAEMEHTQQLRKKELAIIEKNRDGEVKELAAFYTEKGLEQSDALTIVSLLVQYKDLFLEHVMAFQHGVLGEEEEDKWQPLKQGFVCFLAFVVFGMVPLFGFIVFFVVDGGKSNSYWVILAIAYGLTALTLFTMGVTKAKLTGSNAALKSGMLMVFNGTFAGGMAFLLGEALVGALGNIA